MRAENFSPDEEIFSPNVQDTAMSTKNSVYPPPDADRLEERPGSAFMYLSVEELPTREDKEAYFR